MLAGLEVVHLLIRLVDQVVHGGNVRLKAGAADADLDLIGLAGSGVGGVQLSLDGSDQVRTSTLLQPQAMQNSSPP